MMSLTASIEKKLQFLSKPILERGAARHRQRLQKLRQKYIANVQNPLMLFIGLILEQELAVSKKH